MSGFAEYESYDALGLAALVRTGEVGATEVLEAAIARVEARNPAVNAVVTKLYDHAAQAIEAGLPEGPFTGVPYLLKDLFTSLAGVRCAHGSRFFADLPPATDDSLHVARLKQAGMVIYGMTSSCELGLSLTCEPQLYGPSRNPWDLERTPAGSSGGAGAAVGARHAADRPRLRRLRLDPRTGGLLRPGRPAPDSGAQHPGARSRRGARRARHRARGVAHGARQCGAARCDRRSRPG